MTAASAPNIVDIDPLASASLQFAPTFTNKPAHEEVPHHVVTPFTLRWLRAAEPHLTPNYCYDPERQIAVTPSGAPLVTLMTKDWTTTSYSTDGEDPPSSEEFGWEEM